MVCPKCKGRATKMVSLTEGKIKCQQCGYSWRPKNYFVRLK